MEQLFQYLNGYYPLTGDLKARLTELLRFKRIRKREFILEEGQICEKIYFIERGLLRCYHLKDGNQVSNWFMKEGDVAIAVESFFGRIRLRRDGVFAGPERTSLSVLGQDPARSPASTEPRIRSIPTETRLLRLSRFRLRLFSQEH